MTITQYIESALKAKTREAIQTTRKQVVAELFSDLGDADALNEELIPGHKLTPDQHKKVLAAYVHRYTGEHTPNWAEPKYEPTHKTDADWVKDHAFHFNKKTGELSQRHRHAEPAFMAKEAKDLDAAWQKELAHRRAIHPPKDPDKVHKGFHPPGYDPHTCPACAKHVAQQEKGETVSQLSGGRYASEFHNVNEEETAAIDHKTNPYHDILTKHGFVHAGSKAEKNRFAPDKHEYVEHVYTHPGHGKSHVVVTQDTKYTGHKGSDYKPHHFVHRHEQENGIMAPSTGDSKPQLHRSLSYHYGVPKGMEAPKLTAWEKKYPHGAPKYKMNEEALTETNKYTHKIWTGPTGVKKYASMLHKHYPNTKAGTEHVYVHTDHPAEHVADTMKNKLGLSGFSVGRGWETRTHTNQAKAKKKAVA